MAYSYKEYVGDGSTDTFALTFEYSKQSDVSVFVGGVQDTSFTFTTSGTVQTSTVPSIGEVIRVVRNTDITNRAVDFTAGSVLTEQDLDNSNIQVYYAAQEALDTAGEGLFKTADGKFDAQSRVIKNVADPVNAQDAVTKEWAETSQTAQLSLAATEASNAAVSATDAASSESAAAASATTASNKASDASISEANALASQTAAAASESAAALSESAAASSEGIASTKAAEASTSAANASTSAATSTAQANVSTNAAATSTAQATSATNSANSASSSAATATTKASEASTSATSAASSATQAQAYRDTTLGYRDSASTSASNALASQTASATSETNAATSASNAATSETNAANSATSAASSAASAAALLDNFDDRYLGAKASDPTVDNDGNPLVTGALYFNTSANEMRAYEGTFWVAASSASIETMDKFAYTATAGQTVFTGADANTLVLALNVGAEIVTLNGIVLEQGTDYTASAGSITLTTGASVGDELNVFAFGNFSVADTVSASTGGTFQSNIVVSGNVDATTFTQAGAPLEAGAKEGIFWENSQTVSSNYTITSGKNAGTFGPVTIADGVTVTIPDGSTWTVI